MRRILTLFAVVSAAAAQPAGALDVYLLRHAETVGNATGRYTAETESTFSEKGRIQVEGIVEKLGGYAFDAILASPTIRTRMTILPHLKAHGLQAEIWPEFEECACGHEKVEPHTGEIPAAEGIELEPENAAVFLFRDEAARNRYDRSRYAYDLARIRKGCDLIRSRYGGSGKSILIVAHNCAGSRILETLLGVEPRGRFGIENATLSRLTQQADGSFELVMLNDRPIRPRFFWQQDETRLPEPGRPLSLALVPEHYAQPGRDYRLAWRMLRGDGSTAADSGGEYVAGPGDELARIEVATDGAAFGETWRLEASLSSGADVLQSWTEDMLFPTYVSLAGTWLIRPGDEPGWAAPEAPDDDWQRVAVPEGWERNALPDYDGIAWYRLHFSVPAESLARWDGRPLAIAMGAIDDADVTLLNGVEIGRSGVFPPAKETAYDRPRVYEFSRDLLAADNVLAVRVSDWGGGGGIWRYPVAVGPADELRAAAEHSR